MEFDKDIWIVEECSNPSTDYYILPALKILEFENRIMILNRPPQKISGNNLTIIFVRYLTKDWVSFVEKNRKVIKKIIYFMDDDLFDLKVWYSLPLRYLKKIFLKAYRWKKWLLSAGADFFVSTEYLAEKYSYLNPLILPPYPVFDLPLTKTTENIKNIKTIFYHGTASHKHEIKWLYNIVKEISSTQENIVFEIVGDYSIYKKFQPLEKVIVVHPMKWALYRRFLATKDRHIGLVPILDNSFNRARSYTKFFEIVACGAVGIYSKESCYKNIISHDDNGILLLNNKPQWIETIKKLVQDEEYRLKLYFNSLKQFENLKKFAEKIYMEDLIWRLK